MTTFETLVLVFYMLFAFGYMIKVFEIDKETGSIWFRAVLVFTAALEIIFFPMVLGIDIYNKLNDYGKKE